MDIMSFIKDNEPMVVDKASMEASERYIIFYKYFKIFLKQKLSEKDSVSEKTITYFNIQGNKVFIGGGRTDAWQSESGKTTQDKT